MTTYRVTDTETGRVYDLTGDSPPTEQELAELFTPEQKPFMDRMKDTVSDLVAPPKEDYQELPYIYNKGGEDELSLYQQKDPTAQMAQDKYGNTLFAGEQGTFYPDQPGFTPRDIPRAVTAVTEGLQTAAPSIAGGVATAPMGVLPAAATMFGVGATSGGTRELANSIVEDRNYDWSKPLIEGAIDAGGEVVGRAVFAALKPVAMKVFGSKKAANMLKEDGSLSDEGVQLLKQAEESGELEKELVKLTRSGALTAEEAKRANLFIKHGMQPTKAQVTRTADDFQAQQEAFKRSGEVRTAIEAQDVQIKEGFEGAVPRQTGDAYWLVRNKVDEVDTVIDDLYTKAREAAPDEKNIKLDGLLETLNKYAGDNASTGNHLITAIRAELKRQGVLGKKGVQGRISVEQAEEVRKHVNRIAQSSNSYGKGLAKELKDSLDDDVFRVAGLDYYETARGVKATLEESLNRTKSGRRDKRTGAGLLRDVVENRISPDDFLQKIKLKGTRASDLGEYKAWLLGQGDEGKAAWDSLRRDVMDDIVDTTFRGATGERGVPIPTRNNMDKAMKAWESKLDTLFSGKEREFLDDMMNLLKYREPVTGTALGRGPSAQGITYAIERLVRKLPLAGDVSVDLLRRIATEVTDMRLTREVLDAGLDRTAKGITDAQINIIREELRRAFSPVGGVVAGAGVAASD